MPFQGYFRCRCQLQKEVIGHDYKFMQEKLYGVVELTKTFGLIGELGEFSKGSKSIEDSVNDVRANARCGEVARTLQGRHFDASAVDPCSPARGDCEAADSGSLLD
jgi:hypothetical protein